MNKLISYVFTIWGLFFLSACGTNNRPTTVMSAEDSLATTILKVNECAKLYTSEIQVHKIVTFDDVSRLKGSFFSHPFDIKLPLGSRKVAIPVDATLKAYIDFTHFSKDNIHTDSVNGQRKLTITLPDPHIVLTASKVDHAGTKEYVSWLRSRFSDAELADYTRQGVDEIVKAIPQMNIMEQCRQQATYVLVPLFTKLGYDEKDITIVFRNDMTSQDLPSLTQIIN